MSIQNISKIIKYKDYFVTCAELYAKFLIVSLSLIGRITTNLHYSFGKKIGEKIIETYKPENLNKFLEILYFLGFGKIDFIENKKIFICKNCPISSYITKFVKTPKVKICVDFIQAGILAYGVKYFLDKNLEVEEIECKNINKEKCVFKIFEPSSIQSV
ncbi:MAG: hypothetical protein QXP52_01770 [Candidatus Aenigmatarchaeota archaeon]